MSNPARPMPPSPTVKDAKRMRKESGARYDDPLLKAGVLTKIVGDGDSDPYMMAAPNNFNQDSNMSSGMLKGNFLIVDYM